MTFTIGTALSLQEINAQVKAYELLEKIGEGAHGMVFKGKQLSTGQWVALKTLKPDALDTNQGNQLKRFERECELCASINHPNIVKLIDQGYFDSGVPFAIYEYISGITLKEYIGQQHGLEPTVAQNLMIQVVDALNHAHEAGITHRDLKPQNIMVVNTDTVPQAKVLDFGVGTLAPSFRSGQYQTITLTQEYIGTPSYSSPEQLRGEFATPRSDLYAAGLILLECLTGTPVFKGKSTAEIFQQQLMHDQVPLPPALLSHESGSLLRQLLEKHPDRRTASALDLLKRLQQINFSSLVGIIAEPLSKGVPQEAVTESNDLGSTSAFKKHITIVCIKPRVFSMQEPQPGFEVMDALGKDLIYLCKDTCSMLGGYVVESISNNLIVYFGYPQAHDSDVRRAAKAAFEVQQAVRDRSLHLEKQHGIQATVSMSLHSGPVSVMPGQAPEGGTVNLAFDLLYQAEANDILATGSFRKKLDKTLQLNYSALPENGPIPLYKISGSANLDNSLIPMVGREAEKEKILVTLLERELRGKLVGICGQAGMGKSLLVDWVAESLIKSGYPSFRLSFLPETQNNALYPILSFLKAHFGLNAQSDEKSLTLLRTALSNSGSRSDSELALLCSWLSIPPPENAEVPDQSPEAQKKLLFRLLTGLFNGLNQKNSFLLILEDTHWIDPTSSDFIDFIVKQKASLPFSIILTSRNPETQEARKTDLDLSLKSLTESAVRALVSETTGRQNIASTVVNYLVERTNGIPLFVEELTSMLWEDQVIFETDGQVILKKEADGVQIPETLTDLLNERLDRTGHSKDTAQLAAGIGRAFDLDLLIKASPKPPEEVYQDLKVLSSTSLLLDNESADSGKLLFRHALFRDAAYESMTTAVRKINHQQLAKCLETHFPGRVAEHPFEVARHWAGSESYDKALAYSFDFVKQLSDKSAYQEALGVKATSLKWIGKITDEEERINLELSLNEKMLPIITFTSLWGIEDYLALSQRNQLLLNRLSVINGNDDDLGNSNIKTVTEWMLFSNYIVTDQHEKALNTAQSILPRLKTRPDKALELSVYAFLAKSYRNQGKLQKALDTIAYVESRFDKAKDIYLFKEYGFCPYIFATCTKGMIFFIQGKPNTALSCTERAIKHARTVGHVQPVANALRFHVKLLALLGEIERAKACLDEVESDYMDALKGSNTGKYLVYLSEWAERTPGTLSLRIDENFKLNRKLASRWFEVLLVDIYLNNQDYETAKSWLFRVIPLADPYVVPVHYKQLGLCNTKLAMPWKEVAAHFKKSIRMAQKNQSKWIELECQYEYCLALLQYEHPPDKALKHLAKLLSVIDEGHDLILYKKAKAISTSPSIQWSQKIEH